MGILIGTLVATAARVVLEGVGAKPLVAVDPCLLHDRTPHHLTPMIALLNGGRVCEVTPAKSWHLFSILLKCSAQAAHWECRAEPRTGSLHCFGVPNGAPGDLREDVWTDGTEGGCRF